VSDPAAQYRAELDFEITFSNGGSLRGEGFRIDIAGSGPTEDEPSRALPARRCTGRTSATRSSREWSPSRGCPRRGSWPTR